MSDEVLVVKKPKNTVPRTNLLTINVFKDEEIIQNILWKRIKETNETELRIKK